MRILFLTTAYGPGRPHAPLIESLAALLAGDGHQVRVAGVNWDAEPGSPPRHYVEPSGVEVLMAAPAGAGFGRIGRLLGKWVLSSGRALPHVRRAFGEGDYDIMLAMTPLVTSSALIGWARKRSRHSIAYITDFFPIQHASTGLFPHPLLTRIAQRAETRLMRGFDTLAAMSPLGARFLKERYDLDPAQPIETLYLWTEGGVHEPRPRDDARRRFGLPLDKRIVVFSGQITSGRGVEEVLAAARAAPADMLFLFVGAGPLRPLVEAAVGPSEGRVALMDPLERGDYLDVIASCDAGLVATVAELDAPTFPSKTIDYLKAGLPIVASVERTTDYDSFVNERGIGVAVHAGDPARLLAAAEAVTGDAARNAAMRAAGRETLLSVFAVRRAADQILRLPARGEKA